MSRHLLMLTGAAALLASVGTLGAQGSATPAYCAPGAAATCFGVRLMTAPGGEGTLATLTLQNLQGATGQTPALPGPQAAWSRLVRVILLAKAPNFPGTDVGSIPQWSMAGGAEAVGDVSLTWGGAVVEEPTTGVWSGYALATDPANGGAELVGCTLPSPLNPPYIRTCAAGGATPTAVLSFSTGGSWTADMVEISLVFSDPKGTFECVVSERPAGDEDPFACERVASNAAPTARITGPTSSVEGASVAFAGSGTDPDGDALTYAWDLDDDGTFETSGATASRTFADDGSYTVRFRATDAHGASTVASAGVTVANAAPVVKTLKLDATILNRPRVGQGFPVSFVWTDRGALDAPWSWSIDWGDGATSSGTLATQSQVDASHTYAAAGTYTLTFRVTDKDGGTATKSIPVQVQP